MTTFLERAVSSVNRIIASVFEMFVIYLWLSLPVHSGSLKKIDYPKQLSGPPSFF